MKRRLVIITIWIISILLFASSVWLIDINYKNNTCREIQIFINAPFDAKFITEQDIRSYLGLANDSLVGNEIEKINIEKIEKLINKIPFVLSSKVYISLGRVIKIKIEQRIPIVRVQNMFNQGFYISEDGYLLPIVNGKTARVLFANGFIRNLFVNSLKLELNSKTMVEKTVVIDNDLLRIYKTANFINQDPFWKAQIQQLFLDKNGNLLMMPLVGDHIINLGDINDITVKFEKLRTFYKKPDFLASWDKYDTININFIGQIVCSKKTMLKSN